MKAVTKALKEGRCVALEGDTEGFFITKEGAVIHWTEGRGSYLQVLLQGKTTEIALDVPATDPDEEELRKFLLDSYPNSPLTVGIDEDLQNKLCGFFR